MTVIVHVVESENAGAIVLESVNIDCHLDGMLSETTFTQTYRNRESFNIEATYTFPLPVGAVLLALQMTIKGQTFHGGIEAKTAAKGRYEDVLEAGHSAILLETVGPDAYSLKLGNLMAGEQAVVLLRYAQLHHWQGDSLRLQLPATIAPRYCKHPGEWRATNKEPESSLNVTREFKLCVSLKGMHARAGWECPSHLVSETSGPDVTRISVSGDRIAMGRDFVLILAKPPSELMPGIWVPEGNGAVALASFNPKMPASLAAVPRKFTLLLDCSYSMCSDSFDQARTVLQEILALLKPTDHFNVIAFGGCHRPLFVEPAAGTPDRVARAAEFVRRLSADMGDAELGAALHTASRLSDVLLITNGEVAETDGLIAKARKCNSRVFTIGVGSAVSATFLRQLAEASGGACELVSPNEQMVDQIARHFRRMEQPHSSYIRASWPTTPATQSPARIKSVYADDTLHLFGWLDATPNGTAALTIEMENGQTGTSEVTLSAEQTIAAQPTLMTDLPRIAAHTRLPEQPKQEAAALAVEHQLISDDSSCILVQQRSATEQASQPPAYRKVRQEQASRQGRFEKTVVYSSSPSALQREAPA